MVYPVYMINIWLVINVFLSMAKDNETFLLKGPFMLAYKFTHFVACKNDVCLNLFVKMEEVHVISELNLVSKHKWPHCFTVYQCGTLSVITTVKDTLHCPSIKTSNSLTFYIREMYESLYNWNTKRLLNVILMTIDKWFECPTVTYIWSLIPSIDSTLVAFKSTHTYLRSSWHIHCMFVPKSEILCHLQRQLLLVVTSVIIHNSYVSIRTLHSSNVAATFNLQDCFHSLLVTLGKHPVLASLFPPPS